MASTLPPGFIVVQLDDKRWYPVEVYRSYSARYPEGEVFLSMCTDYSPTTHESPTIHFKRRDEAIAYCQQEARSNEAYEQHQWERVAVGSDLYPERCSHYLDLITEITGQTPAIYRYLYDDTPNRSIALFHHSWRCSCGEWHAGTWVRGALYIEDALAEMANAVYASAQECQCTQPQEDVAPIAV